jgi:ribosomal protein S18 acetylase RimI-like enzyme
MIKLDHRPFQETDAPTICSFPCSADELFFMTAETDRLTAPDQLKATLGQGHDPMVGLWEGRVAGYADFVEVHAKKFCAIGHLVVDPQLRRKGVGTYLVGIMIQKAIDQYAIRFVRASCISHNQPAYALFHKLGFRPATMVQRLGPDGDPVLMIHLHLLKRYWKGRGIRQDPAGG